MFSISHCCYTTGQPPPCPLNQLWFSEQPCEKGAVGSVWRRMKWRLTEAELPAASTWPGGIPASICSYKPLFFCCHPQKLHLRVTASITCCLFQEGFSDSLLVWYPLLPWVFLSLIVISACRALGFCVFEPSVPMILRFGRAFLSIEFLWIYYLTISF